MNCHNNRRLFIVIVLSFFFLSSHAALVQQRKRWDFSQKEMYTWMLLLTDKLMPQVVKNLSACPYNKKKKKQFLKKGAHPSSCLQVLNPQRCRLKNIKGQRSNISNLLYCTDCGAETNIRSYSEAPYLFIFISRKKKYCHEMRPTIL